MIDHGTV